MQNKATNKLELINEDLELNPFDSLVDKALSGADTLLKANEAKPYVWLAEGLIENRGFHALFARAKRGKSIIAAYLADAISKGKNFNEYSKNVHSKPVKTLYIDSELEEVEWKQRYGDSFLMNLSMDVLFKDSMATHTEQFSQSPEALVDFLRACVDKGYELIVLDSISYSAINISDVKQAQKYKLALNKFAGELLAEGKNVSFLFVAHMTKAISNKNGRISFELMQGASDWNQLYRNLIGVGAREDLPEDVNGIYLKAEGRSRRPDSIGNKCLPFIKADTQNLTARLIAEEPKYEDELIKPSEVVNSSKKDEVRVTLLAILEASKVITNVQKTAADWTGTQQGHISRAKKTQEEKYKEVKSHCNSSTDILNYWAAIKDELNYGTSLPFEFSEWLKGIRKEVASSEQFPF